LKRSELGRSGVDGARRRTGRPNEKLTRIEKRRGRFSRRKWRRERLRERFGRSEHRSFRERERELLFATQRLRVFPAAIVTSDITEGRIRRKGIRINGGRDGGRINNRSASQNADVRSEWQVVQGLYEGVPVGRSVVSLGFEFGAIFGSQNLRALQIVFGVNVLRFFPFLAGAFLFGGLGDILRGALRRAHRRTGEKRSAAQGQTEICRTMPHQGGKVDGCWGRETSS
jgi:hypothetical protein